MAEKRAPIIGSTCAFDAKNYKIVGGIFAISASVEWNKNFFQFSDFCSALQSFLVDLLDKILPILTLKA